MYRRISEREIRIRLDVNAAILAARQWASVVVVSYVYHTPARGYFVSANPHIANVRRVKRVTYAD